MSEAPSPTLSIVVPLGPGEPEGRELLEFLSHHVRPEEEILVLSPEPRREKLPQRIQWIVTERGRARQQNEGARNARGRVLWFLHGDSILNPQALEELRSWAARNEPEHASELAFFRLGFSDGSRLMRINEQGVRFRSEVLGMPFGDQGLALPRRLFFELGGFDESAPFGEDHLLVWRAHRLGIPLRPLRSRILTSARKYSASGWWKTTWRHMWLAALQATPEAQAVFRRKRKRSLAVAVFVKTPGLSPLKTRLARAIGEESAKRFHALACACLQETLCNASASAASEAAPFSIEAYWAIAESWEQAGPRWIGQSEERQGRPFCLIEQGSGELGDRLHRVYSRLIERHSGVLLLGADSPQLTPRKILDFLEVHKRAQTSPEKEAAFALARAEDGGFVGFLGTRPLPRELWRAVPYSATNTADELLRLLPGTTKLLETEFDVDELSDLPYLRRALEALPELKPPQKRLLDWLRSEKELSRLETSRAEVSETAR